MKTPNSFEKLEDESTTPVQSRRSISRFFTWPLLLVSGVVILLIISFVVALIVALSLTPFSGCVLDLTRCDLSRDNGLYVTEEWFSTYLQWSRSERVLGEYLYNDIWYLKDDNGVPIVGQACSCKATDFRKSTVGSRNVTRKSVFRNQSWSVWTARNYLVEVDETFIQIDSKQGDPLVVYLLGLPPSLYSFYVYGTVAAKGRSELNRVWEPAPMEFRVYKGMLSKEPIMKGLLLLKQGFKPRRMQGFHFHAFKHGNYRLEFNLHHTANETVQIMWIRMVDQMWMIPDEQIKTEQLGNGAAVSDIKLTDERLKKDQQIWENFVHFNIHVNFDGHADWFKKVPSGGGSWQIKDWLQDDGTSLPYYKRKNPEWVFPKMDLIDMNTNKTITQEEILDFKVIPNENYPDYGACFYHDSQYNCKRATELSTHYLYYYGTIVNDPSAQSSTHALKCYYGNDANAQNYCHDGAVALVRLALDWPALEMCLKDVGYNTHTPDMEYNTDWTTHTRRNGKFFYSGWSGAKAHNLIQAYDELFPYISSSKSLVKSLKRFVPWIKKPGDVVRLLDRYLVFSSVRDYDKGIIRTGSIPSFSGTVLGIHPYTFFLLDFTKVVEEVHPMEGTIQELYGTVFNRDGTHYIGSASYAIGMAQMLIGWGDTTRKAKLKGFDPKFDLTDVDFYSKIKSALGFIMHIFVAGTHQGIKDWLSASCGSFSKAYNLYSSPLAAWGKAYCGSNNTDVVELSKTVDHPIKRAKSRIIHASSAIIEVGTNEDSIFNKHAVTMTINFGSGHAHADFLDLNIWSLGLPMAVDIGQRNEGDLWTRPSASWSYLHNHAFGHDVTDGDNNPKNAGGQTGEPFLSSFAEQSMRGTYFDSVFRLDREIIVMDLDESNNIYVFDVQRVKGGGYHTWNFHGCESHQLDLNVAMAESNTRWINRHLVGTLKNGTANAKLEAVWEMSREELDYPHEFNGGGTISTYATESHVLGGNYEESRSTANTKATLLGHAGDHVMEGFAYSEHYRYAFPFLYVQSNGHSDSDVSIFPAIYEMYRGTTALISDITLNSLDPVQVTVTSFGGQIDSYFDDGVKLSVVSLDSSGTVRFAKLNRGTELTAPGISISVQNAEETASILDVDYFTKTITLSSQMPANPLVVVSNPLRSIHLQLYGNLGTVFTFDDDLIVAEGRITEYTNLENGQIVVGTNQGSTDRDFVYMTSNDNSFGNRKQNAFTFTNEDFSVQFRNQEILVLPDGSDGILTKELFVDSNGDGKVNLKAYDIGIEETVTLCADVTIKRFETGYKIRSNVPVNGNVEGISFSTDETDDWIEIN